MKKSTIWLLILVMTLTFAGLLYLQITYMENIVKMRNEQFSEAVKRSLYEVSSSLQQDETKRYLEEDIEENQKRLLTFEQGRNNLTGLSSTQQRLSLLSPDGTISNLSYNEQTSTIIKEPVISGREDQDNNPLTKTYRGMQEILKGQYLYQKGLLESVILKILNTASNHPIMERIDPKKVENYLRSEFQNNGLNIPFQFAITSRSGKILYNTPEYTPEEDSEIFSQVIFPNDPLNKLNYLKVYFPTKQDYILSSVRFMIPSFAFTLILLITFLFTIIIAFRQKRLTEMKNDFINNMTHEFKTPISTISLAAQMLKDPAVAKSPQMFQHISGVINDETKRLRFQVEKVLQMSMFERQKTMMKLTTVDANDLVTSVMSTFKLKVEKFGGTIDADLDTKDALIMVDEMHFTNVIFNLLDNAVKYAREDVPLELMIRTLVDGDKVEISVQDNGIGIKKEDLKKIFDKFYRVSTGNLHNVKGFGLGLAYVYKIVKDLKGSIRAESELGVGTKFIITLPLIKNK
ncbi:sensor histidine kinase [Coprobacter tertius]|uniref:histidine kinase n=1 Tax=Coprobacter tertius TaxID=2944915 RepID=A0ABT1MF00_9BACT|nr:HAMP domain-containing sensor histidine kinase [Coprobacter tertius]MCP9611197.1 HAMP domain-containing histidine kinase [Coprobacter tertius]